MAYVSIRWSKASAQQLRYVLKERGQDDVTYAHDCTTENAIADFESVRVEHGKTDGNHVLHVVQSFSPGDSNRLDADAFNSIGRSLAARNFPGHQFIVRTHTDTDKIHNHIVVNTVNSETGKKVENKRRLIFQLQDSSDSLCKEYGLSVINRDAKERAARLPYKVQQMVRNGKQSYIFDLSQKADVARSIATNFDEYRDTMSGFGIRVLVEEKNISYFYSGRERGKRGSKLGRNYDKDGLVERFTANQEKFARAPELRAYFERQGAAIQKSGMPKLPEGASRFTQQWSGERTAWNDPESFTKVRRRESEKVFQSDRKLARDFVPADEIKLARGMSIFDYCKQNKIALTTNADGKTVLKGKEFVHVSEFEFTNTKNGTRGSLVDLVAAHKNMTLIQAVAHLNSNPRLLLLERAAGEVTQKFRSFYFPKPEKTVPEKIARALQSFSRGSSGPNPLVKRLHEFELARPGVQNAAWLFMKVKPSAGSFAPDAGTRSVGSGNRAAKDPLTPAPNNSDQAARDFEMMAFQHESAMFALFHAQVSHATLMIDPKVTRTIDLFLIGNPGVKKLNLFSLSPGEESKADTRALDVLKKRYHDFGIEICDVSNERALDRALSFDTPAQKDRGRGRGPDIGF